MCKIKSGGNMGYAMHESREHEAKMAHAMAKGGKVNYDLHKAPQTSIFTKVKKGKY